MARNMQFHCINAEYKCMKQKNIEFLCKKLLTTPFRYAILTSFPKKEERTMKIITESD